MEQRTDRIGRRLGAKPYRRWRFWRPFGYVVALLLMVCCAACLERGVSGGTPDLGLSLPSPSSRVEGLVVGVIDGDTIRIDVGGTLRTVRYIGIDAPERSDPFGPAATKANQALVGGAVVVLERDVSETDDYGRWLRYVYLLDGVFVNGELVRQGLAHARAYPPDTSRHASLARLEQEARAAGRGLWEHTESGSAQVRIVAVDKRAEMVDLTNLGEQPQDMTGWTLVSERGQETCVLRGSLDPGVTLRVWFRAEDAARGGYNCGFEQNVWNNDEPDPAALYDAKGRLVDLFP